MSISNQNVVKLDIELEWRVERRIVDCWLHERNFTDIASVIYRPIRIEQRVKFLVTIPVETACFNVAT